MPWFLATVAKYRFFLFLDISLEHGTAATPASLLGHLIRQLRLDKIDRQLVIWPGLQRSRDVVEGHG